MLKYSPEITHEQGRPKRIRTANPEKNEKMATVTFLDDSESKKDHKLQKQQPIQRRSSSPGNNKTASFLEYMNCNKIESKRKKLEIISKGNINKAEGLKKTNDTNNKLKRSSLMVKDAEIYTSDYLVPWHENK